MRKLCIVGDRFSGLAQQEDVSTIGDFIGKLADGALDNLNEHLLLVGGQGLGDYEWEHLAETVSRRGLADRISLQAGAIDLASRDEAHKHRENKVLVDGLIRHDDRHFHADLRVHNDNELLLDHQTGQHMQGMVVVEASRQMFLAVTERYFASTWPRRKFVRPQVCASRLCIKIVYVRVCRARLSLAAPARRP
jgi:hypothetical protein